MSDAAVTMSPPPEPTRIFRPGEIVAGPADLLDGDPEGWIFGEVVPQPADEGPAYAPDVWVRWRRTLGPQIEHPDDLERVDSPRAIRNVLGLLAEVGIRISRHEVGISDEVAELVCDADDEWPGLHAYHANALVLWFESDDDLFALQELSYRGPFEFGCNWPSFYPGPLAEGVSIRAVHLADLPDLARLLRSELDGELGGGEGAIRRRWLARSAVQISLLALASEFLRVVIFGRAVGIYGVAAIGSSVVVLGLGLYRRVRLEPIAPRRHLDAVRTRSRRAAREGGPR